MPAKPSRYNRASSWRWCVFSLLARRQHPATPTPNTPRPPCSIHIKGHSSLLEKFSFSKFFFFIFFFLYLVVIYTRKLFL